MKVKENIDWVTYYKKKWELAKEEVKLTQSRVRLETAKEIFKALDESELKVWKGCWTDEKLKEIKKRFLEKE